MIYLITQEWSNTSNNHAGMKYLCNKLQELYPNIYCSFVIPCFIRDGALSSNRIVKKIQLILARYRTWLFCKRTSEKMASTLVPGDIVFLMEYLERLSPMNLFANAISKRNILVTLWAMVHLVPAKLNETFPKDNELHYWMKNIQRVFTLGHSLTNYLIMRGLPQDAIFTSFHYVDNYYLIPEVNRKMDRVKVIAMGNQVRNIGLLRKIVAANSRTDFTICQGVVDMSDSFAEFRNVDLIPYVPESKLRSYMSCSDISLNVMDDTIGSNVIVTSMAMGLAMVCSDVGSIHDYCDDSNAIFCSNDSVDDFNNAIEKLTNNPMLLYSMRQSARNKAENFSIENFHKDILKNMG